MMSIAPPGGNGTTMRTGFSGYVPARCADAVRGTMIARPTTTRAQFFRVIVIGSAGVSCRARSAKTRSIRPRSRYLDDLLPFRLVVANPFGKLLGRAGQRLGPLCGKAVFHVLHFRHLA